MSRSLKCSTSFIFPFYNALKCNICISRMGKRSTSQVKVILVMLATQRLCLAAIFFWLGGGGGVRFCWNYGTKVTCSGITFLPSSKLFYFEGVNNISEFIWALYIQNCLKLSVPLKSKFLFFCQTQSFIFFHLFQCSYMLQSNTIYIVIFNEFTIETTNLYACLFPMHPTYLSTSSLHCLCSLY